MTVDKKVFIPIGWAFPILIFESGLGKYSPDEKVQQAIDSGFSVYVPEDKIVNFNEYNLKPHRAYGEPIELLIGSTIEDKALQFIQNELSSFNIPIS